MRRAIAVTLAAAVVATVMVPTLGTRVRSALGHAWSRWHGPYTVDDRLGQFGTDVAARLAPAFSRAGVAYPPREVAYLAFKDQRVLELHARDAADSPWRFVKHYTVQAASGGPGPKLAEGDHQVPEGVYQAEFLNANSRFHVSIRLNYPNAFDREMARRDGRVKLGGDIMIHGSAVSVGCLAMGDEAAEELFALAALVTPQRTRIVVSPTDFRVRGADGLPPRPAWVPTLYEALRVELQQYGRGVEGALGAATLAR